MIARLLVAMTLAVAAPIAAADVNCRGEYELAGDVDLDLNAQTGDLVFKRDRKTVVRITQAPELYIDDELVALEAPAQAELVAYRDAYHELIDGAKAIGVAGAKLGGRAAFSMLVGLLTGSSDRVEAEIEAEAAKLEAQAESLCTVVKRLSAHHDTLSTMVPEFAEALPVQ